MSGYGQPDPAAHPVAFGAFSSPHFPPAALAALGAVSGLLSSFYPGPSYGDGGIAGSPVVGLSTVLAGVWFGLTVGFGVWLWGRPSPIAAVVTLAATWVAWEVAVNLAIQLSENWLSSASMAEAPRHYISGAVAGAVGAMLTWVGAAACSPALRLRSAAGTVTAVGAVFGLLLTPSLKFDAASILFVPWQAAVAATFGYFLVSMRRSSTE